MDSTSGVFNACELLNDFVKQVVTDRWEAGLRSFATWLREDNGGRPYTWLRPDFVSPVPLIFPVLRAKILWMRLGLQNLLLEEWMVGPGMRLRLCLFPSSPGWLSF